MSGAETKADCQKLSAGGKPLDLASFDVGVTLGTGSFGRVRFATHKVRFRRSTGAAPARSVQRGLSRNYPRSDKMF